ncbi:hypothetical protein HPO96_20950 [Kribbella sandramycini]|uniref:SH3 domain-containing protein n=1 Tax=Kribbella sandramycini TaxID=60450 RepID=A0A7Y4L3D2_9ACTN|nr:hypothetical protein [Kribbella sandramycini]MBB6566628.1 hypothetical protein [Kribbella sandramycini]NOL42717.1 hypothetical protein [Kribbella sandramycini]
MKSLRISKVFAVGSAMIVMAAGTTAVAAGTAAAGSSACNNTVVGGPNNSNGFLQAKAGSPYRKGPGASYCAYSNREGTGAIWCTKRSADGNPWYLARDTSSGVVGWIWAGNVTSTTGTINNC